MKRILMVLFLIGIPVFGFSQVGINTTNPNAQLDIKSSNQAAPANTDGILIPKIDSFPVTNPTAAQNSMMVYLTTTSAGKSPGFYYWDNPTVSWKGLGGDKGWDLPGNTVSDTTKFVGTVNSTDLIFKSENHRGGRIGTTNTSIGRHALNPMAFGTDNSAFGKNALNSSAQGSGNSAVGVGSLQGTTNGSQNTAIGYEAGKSITIGSNNIAIGANANVPSATVSNQMSIGNLIYGADMSTTALGKIGIGELVPSAKFQISSATPATPANTDGIIIPRVSTLAAPASMTAAQNSMLVYLTTTSAGKPPGFYYWDSTGTPQWKPISSSIPNGTAVGNTMYWNGTSWVNNSSFLFNDGTKVGINTAVPSSIFTVKEDGIGLTQEDVTAGSRVGFYTSAATAYVQTHSNTDLSFATNNGSAQMLLQKTTGNVGIGNTNPPNKLDVRATTGSAVIKGEYLAPEDNAEVSVFNASVAQTNAMLFGKIYGLKNDISNRNFTETWGVQNNFSGNGEGSVYGMENKFLSLTAYADRYGVYNGFGSAVGSDIGMYNQLFGPGRKIGVYNEIALSNQPVYGLSNRFFSTGSFDRYGVYSIFEGTGSGDWYGEKIFFDDTSTSASTGKRFGYHVMISPSIGGSEHYGIYSYAGNMTKGYSAYLSGRVSIGSDTTLASHYTLPFTRGTNGQIMQTDGVGNVTWQNNPAVDADFYEVGGTLPPNAITDSMYHTGDVSIGITTNDSRYKLQANTSQITANGIGQATIYAYRDRDSRNDGSSFGNENTNSAIKGYNYQGDILTFGISGYCYNDFTRTGGVLGSYHNGGYWGSLGYKNSAGTPYGVYASAAGYSPAGTGRMSSSQTQYTIGGGFYGGLIGSWSKGSAIGNISSGTLFASYNSGDEYTSGKQIELVETGSSKTAAYTVTSTDIIVYKKGKIALQNGTAHVAFDADYARLLGDAPIVTTSPMGQCNGIYIESVDKSGFTIRELNNGRSNVTVSWIAVGDRVDSEKKASSEVLDADFDKNINEVMFNDNNLNEKAKALWSQGGKIKFGELPDINGEMNTKKQ